MNMCIITEPDNITMKLFITSNLYGICLFSNFDLFMNSNDCENK